MLHNILIYGGSFDPPHIGHLNIANAVQAAFHFDRFLFLPCKMPVLKLATMATCEQRVHMLALALRPFPSFSLDLREINRNTPSYMIDTLDSYRDELGPRVAITLLIGMDAFLDFPHWHCFEKIIERCHLLVAHRAHTKDMNLPAALEELLKTHKTHTKDDLLQQPAGKIYQFHAGEHAVSSTWLRHQLQTNKSPLAYLPEGVADYIKEQGLYRAPQ